MPLVKGSTDQPAMNPLLSYLSVLLAELRAAETDLGMTPWHGSGLASNMAALDSPPKS